MKTYYHGPEAQRGASIYAMLVVMTLLGLIIFTGLKLSPAYLDNSAVNNAIGNLQESGELHSMSLRDIRTYVSRTMQANGANWDSDNIDQVEEGGVEYLVLDYESRVPLFANIDAVVKFNKRIEK